MHRYTSLDKTIKQKLHLSVLYRGVTRESKYEDLYDEVDPFHNSWTSEYDR